MSSEKIEVKVSFKPGGLIDGMDVSVVKLAFTIRVNRLERGRLKR